MITRFAPSPTGPLHLGHAYAAILAHDLAYDGEQASDGRFLLRIEDIDRARCRPEWVALLKDDLCWLGLTWDRPVMVQSTRLPAYRAALARLWDAGLLYPCVCTRRDIEAAASAPQEGDAPRFGPDGRIYPGTCRATAPLTGHLPDDAVLRIDLARALAITGQLEFTETGAGPMGETGLQAMDTSVALTALGDVVLARGGMGTSYHLSVAVDDAAQKITHVTRGHDLFEATWISVLLQRLLDLPTPVYHHHKLIRDDDGKRLAKRDDARALSLFRAEGFAPSDVRAMVGL